MSKRLREMRLSRARAARAEISPRKFAKEAHDLDALRKTVEDAASVSAGFWLSYLFVLFYIAIAAGASPIVIFSSKTRSNCRFSTSNCRLSRFSCWRRFFSSSRMPIRSSISSCWARRSACSTRSFEHSSAMRWKRGREMRQRGLRRLSLPARRLRAAVERELSRPPAGRWFPSVPLRQRAGRFLPPFFPITRRRGRETFLLMRDLFDRVKKAERRVR
jgi:hypothetical protein